MKEIKSTQEYGKRMSAEKLMEMWNGLTDKPFPIDQIDVLELKADEWAQCWPRWALLAQAFNTIGEDMGKPIQISAATESVLQLVSNDSYKQRRWLIFIRQGGPLGVDRALTREFIYFINNEILWRGNAMHIATGLTDDGWDKALQQKEHRERIDSLVKIRREGSSGGSAKESDFAMLAILRKIPLGPTFPSDRLEMLITLRRFIMRRQDLARMVFQNGQYEERLVPLFLNALLYLRKKYIGGYEQAFRFDWHLYDADTINGGR